MNKLLPTLLGIAFLAFPFGYFLPCEKSITYCVWGGAFLLMLGCVIYGAVSSKEIPNRLTENMLVAAVVVIIIALLPIIITIIALGYLLLLMHIIVYNAKTIYHFFIPWIIGISLLALPLGFLLSNSWAITIAIWIVALVAITIVGIQYIKVLKPHWHKESSNYITYSLSIIAIFLGMTTFVTFFNGFISYDCWWLSLIILTLGGLLAAAIILIITILIVAIIMLINYLLKRKHSKPVK